MEAEGLACEKALGRRTGAMPSPLLTLPPLPAASWCAHGPSLRPMGFGHSAGALSWWLGFSDTQPAWFPIPEFLRDGEIVHQPGHQAVRKPYAYLNQSAVERAIGEVSGHPRVETVGQGRWQSRFPKQA